jgi:hypothetical protein
VPDDDVAIPKKQVKFSDVQDPLSPASPRKPRKQRLVPEIELDDEMSVITDPLVTMEPPQEAKPDSYYLEKYQIQESFILLEQVSVEAENLELTKRARKQKHPKKHDAASFSPRSPGSLDETSTNVQVKEAYGGKKPNLKFKLPVKPKKVKASKKTVGIEDDLVRELMPVPISVKLEKRAPTPGPERETLDEEFDDEVDGVEVGQVQEEILTSPAPLNSSSTVDSPSSGRPNRSILKKNSTDSPTKKKVNFSSNDQVIEINHEVEDLIQEINVAELEANVMAEEQLSAQLEETVEQKMAQMHLGLENGVAPLQPQQEEDFSNVEFLDEVFNGIGSEFLPPTRIPRPDIPVTPDFTTAFSAINDQEPLTIQAIGGTGNDVMEAGIVDFEQIAFSLQEPEPVKCSEE